MSVILDVMTPTICHCNDNTVDPPCSTGYHDDVIKWNLFPRYWPFVREFTDHRLKNSPHKGQCREALMFSFICAWINGWVTNRGAGDLRRHLAHYDVIVMYNMVLHMACQWQVYGQIIISIHKRHSYVALTGEEYLVSVLSKSVSL